MLRSNVEILTPAKSDLLTTLSRAKLELKIDTNEYNDILNAKIEEASSDIQAAMGYRLPLEDVRETFWSDEPGFGLGAVFAFGSNTPARTTLFLKRTPVTSITSVTVDDTVLAPSEIRIDNGTGLLDRLSSSGSPCEWRFCKSVIVLYSGGFVLPGNVGRNLEYAVEGAVLSLLTDYWASRGRDPLIKSVDVPGVRRVEYWVGAVGDPALLPPRVLASISQFRRPAYA